jgi:hypothetical protein
MCSPTKSTSEIERRRPRRLRPIDLDRVVARYHELYRPGVPTTSSARPSDTAVEALIARIGGRPVRLEACVGARELRDFYTEEI